MKNKKCGKCKKITSINNFTKNRNTHDGFCCYCKICSRKSLKKYNDSHKKEKQKYMRTYYKIHKEELREYKKEYNINNKYEITEYHRKYNKVHKKEKQKYNKKYRKENFEELTIKSRIYGKKNKDKKVKRNREYAKKNPQKVKKYFHNHYKKYYPKHKIEYVERSAKRNRNMDIIDHIERLPLLKRHNYTCPFEDACGGCKYGKLKNDKHTHMAHLHSVARCRKAGRRTPHSWSNVIPMKDVCNYEMRDMTPLEFMWKKIKEIE